MFHLYILHSQVNGRYYIGSTDDLDRRLHEHNAGHTPSTRAYRPWALVYTEAYPTRSTAVRRERQVKAWKSREAIAALMAQRQSQQDSRSHAPNQGPSWSGSDRYGIRASEDAHG